MSDSSRCMNNAFFVLILTKRKYVKVPICFITSINRTPIIFTSVRTFCLPMNSKARLFSSPCISFLVARFVLFELFLWSDFSSTSVGVVFLFLGDGQFCYIVRILPKFVISRDWCNL